MRPRATIRLFVVSAALSLVPVVVLGLVMASSYSSEARRRGVAEGRSEAQLIAQTAIEPLLDATPLHGRLRNGPVYDALTRVTRRAVGDHHVIRLRVRNLDGNVVFSDDGSGFAEKAEAPAIAAAHGEVEAELTRLNSDANDTGEVGQQAVEIYQPLFAGSQQRRVGVLELYLPYAPIHDDVASGVRRLSLDLMIGLAALYVVLFAISLSVSRGLRRQVKLNAFLAEHDPLTELPNRRLFQRRIADALNRVKEGRAPFAIAIVDLDRFKDINDSLGHDSGDAVLVELAYRLRDELNVRDTIARLGGDEFGILVDDPSDVDAFLARLREVIGQELVVSAVPLTVEASVGYVLSDTDADDVDELLRRADVALYVAKEQHAGAVRYDPAQDHYDPANLTLVTELRRAIEADELVLHYQPKARLANGRFDAVEALVRWQHPEHGLMLPDQFLPLAEPTELIDALTDWVLTRALTDMRDLHSRHEIGVAVNVSARNFSRPDFADRVLKILQNVGVSPNRLTIEITETALLTDPVRAAIALSQLDAFGVQVSLDDFGTGQTSLRYLTSLPIDELKIDMSFVTDMLENPSHAAIVRAIIDLGHNLGLRVVAEGIETRDVFRALHESGCDIAQGFLLSRPMPVGDLPRFFAAVADASLSPAR
ncbi:MAG: diguanylate cyclase [Actinomycetota bacterium]|nr:diguanylate cyclase [Actinomycetota bacterium]